jgi:hypothetical protein
LTETGSAVATTPGWEASENPVAAEAQECSLAPAAMTRIDGAVWGPQNNRAEDGDYAGTVAALLTAGAPTRFAAPTEDETVDALLAEYRAVRDDGAGNER